MSEVPSRCSQTVFAISRNESRSAWVQTSDMTLHISKSKTGFQLPFAREPAQLYRANILSYVFVVWAKSSAISLLATPRPIDKEVRAHSGATIVVPSGETPSQNRLNGEIPTSFPIIFDQVCVQRKNTLSCSIRWRRS
jgi:hypothetical protein